MATDLTGKIIFWNRHAETLYGWTAEEALGRDIFEVTTVPAFAEPTGALMEQLRRGESWSGEFPVRRRDGTTFVAHVRDVPLLDSQGALIGIAGISRDVTERNQILEANRLLAEASELLAGSADYDAQLNTLANLAVPQLADWCAVHVLQANGSIEQVALAYAETAKLQWAREWLQHYLPSDEAHGLPAVLRSGEPTLVTEATAEQLAAASQDERLREIFVSAGIKSYMILPLIIRPQTLGTITLVAAESGRQFDSNALAVAENLARHVASYLDKAKLHRESQRLNAELEQRVGERTAELGQAVEQLKRSEAMVQTLFRISKKLNATLNVENLLDVLAQEAVQIVNGESGFAGVRTTDGMTVRKVFQNGEAIPFEHTWRVGQDIPGWVLKYKIPYGTSDAATDPVMLHDLPINAGVRSVICTPILDSAGRVLGYFDIRNKRDGPGFTLNDQEMLMALSPVASIAIQNALTYEKRVRAETELSYSYARLRALASKLEAVREEERMWIARELHDQLGQALTALKFDLSSLTARLVGKDATLAYDAKAIATQIDALVKMVRRIATELRPGVLDNLGLAASIEWQAHEFQKRIGIPCTVDAPEQRFPLTRAQKTALFRIFQETLTNIARHAEARHVRVALTGTNTGVTLRVHDDGRGIQHADAAGTHSLGLLGMRERAELLGGTFAIRSAPGKGTTITVTMPFAPNASTKPNREET